MKTVLAHVFFKRWCPSSCRGTILSGFHPGAWTLDTVQRGAEATLSQMAQCSEDVSMTGETIRFKL